MNKENTEKLFNRFKFFYPERSLQESLMSFGFECGDGWFDLIWKLCEKIEPLVDETFSVEQVKEKFGMLRFYVNFASTEVYKLIADAENQSMNICEQCGKIGKIRNKTGWLRTLCGECLKNI